MVDSMSPHHCLGYICVESGRFKRMLKVKVAQSYLTLRPYGLYSPWNSPGDNAGVGSLSLLQGIFPTQGFEPRSPILQADSLPPEPQGITNR